MIAIATDYLGEIPSTYEIEERLKNIAEAGFTHIHWCHDWEGGYIYSTYEIEQIDCWLKKYNLKMKGIHASEGGKRPNKDGKYKYRNKFDNRKDYTSFNEYNRLAGVELIKNRVDLAEKTGATEVVLHMQMPYKDMDESQTFKDKYWEQVFKSFDELEKYCVPKGIRIAVENLIGTPAKYQMEQFDKIFNRYGIEFLGFCFDSGHGVLMQAEHHLEIVRRYKNRLIALHLNDNAGISKEDLKDDVKIADADTHLIITKGSIDLDSLAQIIADSPYKLPITMELSCKTEEKEFLNEAYKIGVKFNELVSKSKK